jgi:spoIIIJ-associated protein
VEVTGRTTAEAKEEAARRFGVGPDQMRVEVVDEGSRGFLGLGSKPARLKVSLKGVAVPAYADAVLSRILRAMGLPDKVNRKKDSEGNTVLDVVGPSGGLLIGRHGQTLECLQYLVSKIVQKTCDDDRSLVVIDIEGYRERQKEKLAETALSMAKKAAESGQTVALQPMSSRERRLVHLALRDHADVTTQSTGEGLRRRVMIVPKRPAPPPESGHPSTNDSGTPAVERGNQASTNAAPEVPETLGNQMPAEAESEIPETAGNLVPPRPPDVDDNIGNKV